MPTCAHHARTRTDIQNSRLWLVADIVDCGSYQIQPTCAHHARIRTARARVYPKKRGKLRTARARARRGARTQTARPWGKRQSLLRVPSIIASGSKFHQKTALTLHADGAPIARARAQVASHSCTRAQFLSYPDAVSSYLDFPTWTRFLGAEEIYDLCAQVRARRGGRLRAYRFRGETLALHTGVGVRHWPLALARRRYATCDM